VASGYVKDVVESTIVIVLEMIRQIQFAIVAGRLMLVSASKRKTRSGKMKLFLHKNQDIVIWATNPDDMDTLRGHYSEPKIFVSYSYLRKNGRVGKVRRKSVYESNFYDEFKNVGRRIEIRWEEKK
jgi:hypothetical protein